MHHVFIDFILFCRQMTLPRLISRDSQILRIAIPSIVSNITVPLLGLVDVAITGHLGAAAYIAAISIGSMVFNTTYWLFGFLRMGSSGLTSQALGRRDLTEASRWLARGLLLALFIAFLLLLFQWPLREAALWLMRPSEEVRQLVTTYYQICIWGAPATLCLYTMNGWFIGMQNTRLPMVIAILQNVVNILASLFFVFVMGMKVEGVALGTLIAQWTGFLMGLALLQRYYGKHLHLSGNVLSPTALRRFFSVNRDIFFRTVCLVSVMLFFTTAGSWQGEVILSVNTLLMQLYLLVSYVMDGFANAAEAMSGKYWGAQNMAAFRQTVRRCFFWGLVCTIAFTLVYLLGGEPFLRLLTDEPSVVTASRSYLFWAWLIPVCSVAAFIWDGVFIGITASRQMLLSSFLAAVVFFGVYFLAFPRMENHGLWLAFVCFMLMRGIVQTVLFQRRISL